MKSRFASLMLGFMLLAGLVPAASPPPVTDHDWGLKIVIFDVGQADAALLLTPDGEAAMVDLGRTGSQGRAIAAYLLHSEQNRVGVIGTLKYLFATHYDADHIGGAPGLAGRIQVQAAYDQGPSAKRDAQDPNTIYSHYVRYVGDSNGNGRKDAEEPAFVRHMARPGQTFSLGRAGNVKISVLSAAGDTRGARYDLPLAPAAQAIDENPGSLIMLVSFNHFRYLTTGDATSDDWRREPDTEEALIMAQAIPGGEGVDVLKVGHHGSDSSSGQAFIRYSRPAVAVINANAPATKDHLPKLTAIKLLELCGAQVLVTGSGLGPDGRVYQSAHPFDDGYTPRHLLDGLGTLTILVDRQGMRYTVRSARNPAWEQSYQVKKSPNPNARP